MPSLDENAILELGRSPVPGPNPTGGDARDDALYISVSQQIDSVGRIDAAAPPNWQQVEREASLILQSKSKDLDMASALGQALYQRYGCAGLSTAIALLTTLVNQYWDGLFPERPRARKARIETLAERFTEGNWFRGREPKTTEDFDALDACLKRIDELSAALTARMPDEPPEFKPFIRILKEQAAKRPAPAGTSAADVASSTGGGGTPGSGGAAFASAPVTDKKGANDAILEAVKFLRQNDRKDPVPYAVLRAQRWADVAAQGGAMPPEAEIENRITEQFKAGLWENVLKNAEAEFQIGDPLWLDLQRYVCVAMGNLGPAYDAARQVVVAMLSGLVRRLGPGLFDLKFTDGRPLCSGETRMWIEAEVAPPASGKSGGAGSAMSNGKLTEATDKARKLAGSGKLADAVKELQDGLTTCTQRRDRLLWRLRIAQICCDAARVQMAAPLLEECRDEVVRHNIGEWEPSLAIEVAQGLYRCRKALLPGGDKSTPQELQGVRESYAWLCQLDPLAALNVDPPGK